MDARRHQVERLGELAELIAGAHLDFVAEVSLADVLRALAERVHRAGDRPGEDEANEDRGHLE